MVYTCNVCPAKYSKGLHGDPSQRQVRKDAGNRTEFQITFDIHRPNTYRYQAEIDG